MTTIARRPVTTTPNRAIDHFSAVGIDQTASRAKATEYQAATTGARVVVVSYTQSISNRMLLADVGAASPPATRVGQGSNSGTAVGGETLMFIVPPGWFYKVTENNATATIVKWFEFNL